jgi:hypothetical protein
MNADPRLIALRLAGNWAAKVDKDQLALDNAFDLLLERVGAIVPKFQACTTCGLRPCPDPALCASWRAADQKLRRCAQCGSHSKPLEPHRSRDKLVYLHKECMRFWKGRSPR